MTGELTGLVVKSAFLPDAFLDRPGFFDLFCRTFGKPPDQILVFCDEEDLHALYFRKSRPDAGDVGCRRLSEVGYGTVNRCRTDPDPSFGTFDHPARMVKKPLLTLKEAVVGFDIDLFAAKHDHLRKTHGLALQRFERRSDQLHRIRSDDVAVERDLSGFGRFGRAQFSVHRILQDQPGSLSRRCRSDPLKAECR